MNLYVDDLRQVPKNFEIARTYEEAIKILKNNTIDILSLDHDLGEEKTGYDIVKYICQNNCKVKRVYLHTFNPIGRENMYQVLLAARARGIIDKNIIINKYEYTESKY